MMNRVSKIDRNKNSQSKRKKEPIQSVDLILKIENRDEAEAIML